MLGLWEEDLDLRLATFAVSIFERSEAPASLWLSAALAYNHSVVGMSARRTDGLSVGDVVRLFWQIYCSR